MSRSKQRGTAWETALCRFLVAEGFPHVERRALNGTQDRGDIAGIPGWVIEAKNCQRTELAGWLDEAAIEQANDGAEFSAVWHHRRLRASPADGFVTMSGATFVRLLRQAGYGEPLDAAADPPQLPEHATVHEYRSTSCLHGWHAYCSATDRGDGTVKEPARCKFCPAPCVCSCHSDPLSTTVEPALAPYCPRCAGSGPFHRSGCTRETAPASTLAGQDGPAVPTDTPDHSQALSEGEVA